MTQYLRLLDKALPPGELLRPLQYALTDKLSPLSTASIVLPDTAPEVAMRGFVELCDDHGSVGVYRVTNIRTDGSGVRTLTLQHGLCTLSDHMHPGESTDTGSCRTLLTKILSNQTRWTLGTVDVPDDQDMTWECSNTNDLQGLLGIVKELHGYYLDFDMSGTPWVLHLRAKSTEVECEARFDRNVVDVQIEYDSTDMCTIAYADGLDAPIKADTYDEWEEIARHVSADEELGVDVITETVERYLEQTKNPRATITITALELSRITGEPFDHFRKGMLCRCILEDRTLIQRIESIERPDVIGEPMNVIITLASTQNDLGVTVAGLVVDTRHVNQLYQQLEKALRIEADTIDMLAAEISLLATKVEVDGLSTRIAQAEISLNDVLGELDLRVTYSDLEDELNEVSLTLDAVNDTLSAKADLILLNGYVKTEDFETEVLSVMEAANIYELTVTTLNAYNSSGVSAAYDNISTSTLMVDGEPLSTSTLTMGDVAHTEIWTPGGDINLSHSHAVTVNVDGTITLGEVSSSGGSFNIADTAYYQDGVSAAQESGYNSGMLDYKPSSVAVAGSINGSNEYLLTVTLTNVFGNEIISFSSVEFDARDAYDNGYDDGYATGQAAAGSYDEGYAAGYAAAKSKVYVSGSIESITNSAPNYMYAKGTAYAYLDGEQLAADSFDKSVYFSWMGQ